MDLQLTDRTAYVTGGAQGIGAAIARRLAAEGVRVAISDIDDSTLAEAVEEISAVGPRPVAVPADLGTAEGAAFAAASATEQLGAAPDILINNVGVAESRPFLETTDDHWLRSFELNFLSCVRTTRELLPGMRERGGGAVVIVSSDLAKQPEPVPADYGSMKAALLYLSKALSREFAPAVRVNAVLPGPVWTGLWSRPGGVVDRLAEIYGTGREEALEQYLEDRQLALGIGQPDDVATLVTFLVSPLAARISGSAYDVGGTIRGLL